MEVKKVNRKIHSDRIRSARESKGLTIRALADKLNISHQMISKYEKGDAIPSPEVMFNIMSILGQPYEYFYKQPNNSVEGLVYYRSNANATQKMKRVHQIKISWLMEIVSDLESIVEFPTPNIPFEHNKTLDYFEPTDLDTIEHIALELRKHWGLSKGPISNLTRLLEKQGIIVSAIKSLNYYVDACSAWDENDRLFILIGNKRAAPSRIKFTLAHELGHAILHKNVPMNEFNKKDVYKRMEVEANNFASAFLLPAESFSQELISHTLDYFRMIKRRWQVSIQAMVYRAKELQIINDYQSSYLWKRIAKNGWKLNEPDDEFLLKESPQIVKEAIELIIDHGVMSKQELKNIFAFSEEDLILLANLEPGYFSINKAQKNVVSFKKKNDTTI